MTAWEELGQVFLCDKQHPYGDCIACFLQNQMQTQFKHQSAISDIMREISLTVQQLKLCAFTAGGTRWIPGQKTKIPHAWIYLWTFCPLIDLYFFWIDLEIVIQSEVSQNEKNKYHIISLTCGIHKNSTDEHIFKAEIQSEMQRTNLYTDLRKNFRCIGSGGYLFKMFSNYLATTRAVMI